MTLQQTETKDSKIPFILMSAVDAYLGHPFDEVFDFVQPVYGADDVETVIELSDRQALIVWGGADISPTIYGEKPSKFNMAGPKLSDRDQIEVSLASMCIEKGIPIIGICRGAQLMCALSGGKLVQHVNAHAGGYHPIVTDDGREFRCPSLHHQMMYPWSMDKTFKMIAWPPKARSDVYVTEPVDGEEAKLKLPGHEPEIIWIPHTKSLCIQSHPEFIADTKHPFVQYCLELTEKYIKGLPEKA